MSKPKNSPGVFVLGMHRSGTSAATLCLESLGLNLCLPEDRIKSGAGNMDHGESRSVVAQNDALLRMFQGTWLFPNLGQNWQDDPEVKNLRTAAKAAFTNTHPNSPWALKDPRLCLTMPFWEEALETKPLVLLVTRNPNEIAKSLSIREDKVELQQGTKYFMALWERYMRTALENARGHHVLVISYDELLDDWHGHREKMLRWLENGGVEVTRGGSNHSPLKKSLRHNDSQGKVEGLSDQQNRLYEALMALKGEHGALALPDIGPESGYTRKLFGAGIEKFSKAYSFHRLLHRFNQFETAASRRKLTSGIGIAAAFVLACCAVVWVSYLGPSKTINELLSGAVTSVTSMQKVLSIASDISGGAILGWAALLLTGTLLALGRRLPALILLSGLVLAEIVSFIFRVLGTIGQDTDDLLKSIMLLGLIAFMLFKSFGQPLVRLVIVMFGVGLAGGMILSEIYFNEIFPSTALAVVLLAVALVTVPITLGEALRNPNEAKGFQTRK